MNFYNQNGIMNSMFIKAFKTSLPAYFCYFPLGIVYGVLCTKLGYPWYSAPLFSLFVFAGAMQFLGLSIMAAGGSFTTLAFALIPLGIRNIFYGLTMLERYKKVHPLLRLYLAHGLVDATYSLLNAAAPYPEKEDTRYITWLTLWIHSSWVLGSLLGSFALFFITLPEGLEFSLTAFFAASATEQYLSNRHFKPIIVAACAILIGTLFFPGQLFLAEVLIAILICSILPQSIRRTA